VVTGKTLGGSALLEKVTGAADARCVAVFKGARQHVPRSSVHELQELIERENADSLIGFGGGSPIDTCKVASHPFLEKREIIQIAIPTTLSAAEYTYGALSMMGCLAFSYCGSIRQIGEWLLSFGALPLIWE